MQRRNTKEMSPCNNPHDIQQLVDESKEVEWQTIIDKGAVRIHYGKHAANLKNQFPDRFIGSRFVIVKKALEENQPVIEDDPQTFRVLCGVRFHCWVVRICQPWGAVSI